MSLLSLVLFLLPSFNFLGWEKEYGKSIFFLFAIVCRPLAARTFEGGRLTSALYNLEKLLKQQHKE